MKEIISTYKKQIIIGSIILIGLLVLLFVFIIPKFSNRDQDNTNLELEIDDLEMDEEVKEEKRAYEIGYALYKEATNIYLMNPYCGIAYEDIDDDSIIIINGEEYYRSSMSSTNDINNKIAETMENSSIMINNTIEKDGIIYCKYNKPAKSNSYLGTTNLSIVNSQDKMITFKATSYYLADNHKETCSINDVSDCSDNDKIKEDNNFVIVNIDGSWKVREFHVHH